MGLTVVRSLPDEQWQRFVDDHPASNIFHTPQMYRVFEQVEGHQPMLWAVVNQNSDVLALFLPVCITLIGGMFRFLTTRAVVYGGVLCQPTPLGDKALHLLLDTYKKQLDRTVLFTELRNISDTSRWQPVLAQHKFVYEEHLNYLVNVDLPKAVVWQNISKSGRQSIRSARNKGTTITEVTTTEALTEAYQILQETYHRVQVPLASQQLFEASFDILRPQGMFKVFLAKVDGQSIASIFTLIYKKRVIDWYAAIRRDFARYSSGELMIWHLLEWGQAQQFQTFDFGGAGRPDEDYGPRKFKAKFGGELVNYGRNVCVHQPTLLKLSQFGYNIARRYL